MKVIIQDINGWVVNGRKHMQGEEAEVSEAAFNSAVNGGVKLTKKEEIKNKKPDAVNLQR